MDKPRTKEGTIDFDAMIEERLTANRDQLRRQLMGETLQDILRDFADSDETLEEFTSRLKKESKELHKFASLQPLRSIAKYLAKADDLHNEIKKLQEENQRLREAKPNGEPRVRRRRSFDRDAVAASQSKVLDYLKANPGSTVGQIARGLMLDSDELKKPLVGLKKSGQVKTEGERRSMRYFHP